MTKFPCGENPGGLVGLISQPRPSSNLGPRNHTVVIPKPVHSEGSAVSSFEELPDVVSPANPMHPASYAAEKPDNLTEATLNSGEFRSLMSELCPGCATHKLAGRSLCRECYRRLPINFRQALYRAFGLGYEDAVAAAVVWLQEQKSQTAGAS